MARLKRLEYQYPNCGGTDGPIRRRKAEKENTMNIIGEWRDIHERAVRLCQTIEGLPDECPCGDSGAHLDGRCSCCGGHPQQEVRSGHHVGCSELLSNLRADFMLFLHDFKGA